MSTYKTTLKPLMPEKVVFILKDGLSAPAVLKSNELRRLVVKGFGYAEFPSGQKAAVYTKDENKLWKFTD
jgi:hypothetical protein